MSELYLVCHAAPALHKITVIQFPTRTDNIHLSRVSADRTEKRKGHRALRPSEQFVIPLTRRTTIVCISGRAARRAVNTTTL
jgi:hypothetical protein